MTSLKGRAPHADHPRLHRKVTRVVILDDYELVREGLRSLLGGHPEVRVVAATGALREVLAIVEKCACDVVILDADAETAIERLRAVKSKGSSIRAVMVATHANRGSVIDALELGADVYTLKAATKFDLLAALRQSGEGRVVLHPRVSRVLLDHLNERKRESPSKDVVLSDRERQVLDLMVQGRNNRDIGLDLGVAENTVKTHLRGLFLKIGVKDRVSAMLWALEAGATRREGRASDRSDLLP